MALALMTALAGDRTARRITCALLMLILLTPAGQGLAEEPDETYSATVKVDATAESAAAARDLARIDGQRRALAAVVERLSGSAEGTKLPKLDDKTITAMVDSFEVANERMSAVRYLAAYTFHFRPSKVRRLARVTDSTTSESGGNAAAAQGRGKSLAAESSSKPIVVLPVYEDGARTLLWDDPNAWREAWGRRPTGPEPVPLTVPLGDASDLVAIDAARAESGAAEALATIAQQNGAEETVVALARAQRQADKLASLEVSVKRYHAGRLIDTRGKTIDANPGESEGDLMKRATDAVAAEIESSVKKSPRADQQGSLAAIVPIANLAEWVEVRNRLASVMSIRKVDLLSLSRREAKIEIIYAGSSDQLRSSLAEVDLDLGGGGPVWRLQRSGLTSLR